MLNYIWAALMLLSFFCALITGRMPQLSEAILSGAGDAVTLTISMMGMMCLWTGLMKIAQNGGITKFLSKLFYPVFRFLFPGFPQGSKAMDCICMNITANLLGMGNAATPLGIAAMKEMDRAQGHTGTASNAMVLFVLINTASIQLIPTTMGALRAKYGASVPFDVLPAVWIVSIAALIFGICIAKLLEKKKARR